MTVASELISDGLTAFLKTFLFYNNFRITDGHQDSTKFPYTLHTVSPKADNLHETGFMCQNREANFATTLPTKPHISFVFHYFSTNILFLFQ